MDSIIERLNSLSKIGPDQTFSFYLNEPIQKTAWSTTFYKRLYTREDRTTMLEGLRTLTTNIEDYPYDILDIRNRTLVPAIEETIPALQNLSNSYIDDRETVEEISGIIVRLIKVKNTIWTDMIKQVRIAAVKAPLEPEGLCLADKPRTSTDIDEFEHDRTSETVSVPMDWTLDQTSLIWSPTNWPSPPLEPAPIRTDSSGTSPVIPELSPTRMEEIPSLVSPISSTMPEFSPTRMEGDSDVSSIPPVVPGSSPLISLETASRESLIALGSFETFESVVPPLFEKRCIEPSLMELLIESEVVIKSNTEPEPWSDLHVVKSMNTETVTVFYPGSEPKKEKPEKLESSVSPPLAPLRANTPVAPRRESYLSDTSGIHLPDPFAAEPAKVELSARSARSTYGVSSRKSSAANYPSVRRVRKILQDDDDDSLKKTKSCNKIIRYRRTEDY